jgi:tetratricopeptide (TPR) repeat protein
VTRSRPAAIRAALVTIVLLAWSPPALAFDPWTTTNADVDEGNRLLAEGKAAEALAKFKEAAADLPESTALHLATGLAQLKLEQHEQAVKEMERALEMAQDDTRGRVLYDLGTTYGRWARATEEAKDESARVGALPLWQKAASYLEKALLLDPRNQDVRINLELALLRVDPPCSARDATKEPDNAPDQARKIDVDGKTHEAAVPGLLCPEDVDYLSADLRSGDRLEASVEPSSGVAIELYDVDGTTRLRPGVDSKEAFTTIGWREGSDRQGLRFLKVTAQDGEEHEYSLKV